MASLTTPQENKTKISHSIKQAKTAQDFATSGTSDDGSFMYIVSSDSHGRGSEKSFFIDLFSKLSWREILQKENFFDLIQNEIKKKNTHQFGSTLSVCKIFADRFEVFWVGDSTTKIYKDSVEIWKSKDHDYNNEEEIERIQNIDTFIKFKDARDVVAISPTKIQKVKSKVFYFGDSYKPDTINMTHSLGHNQNTGDFISHETIPREENGNYKVVTGSDGFWQVMSESDSIYIGSQWADSQTLVNMADHRWRQGWKLDDENGKEWSNIKFPEWNIDDVCVACWCN